MTENTTLYCANHPNVETALRCNRCDKAICAKCAVKTPTGYRCKECVKSQMKIFDTAVWYDYPLGFIAAAFLSLIASFLMSLLGGIGYIGLIIVFVGAPTAGVIIAEGARTVVQRHRSQALFATILAGVVFGALPSVIANVFFGFQLFPLITQGLYLGLAIPTVYSRLSGLQLFK
jgi:hypothetical protein